MRYIDLKTWPRREHFKLFKTMGYPHFSMCANVDLTVFYPAVKQSGISFTVAIIYALARTANALPEFRYRIREGNVIEHDVVHPSSTILSHDDLFSFCTIDFTEEFSIFAATADQAITHVKTHQTIAEEPGTDNLLFMTAIPWVSFTSFTHPIDLNPADSVPRIAWGKFFKEGKCLKMPLNVQVHHAVMDGVHVGRFYAQVQKLLDCPAFLSKVEEPKVCPEHT